MHPDDGQGGLEVYKETAKLFDWGFKAADKVEPVGELVAPSGTGCLGQVRRQRGQEGRGERPRRRPRAAAAARTRAAWASPSASPASAWSSWRRSPTRFTAAGRCRTCRSPSSPVRTPLRPTGRPQRPTARTLRRAPEATLRTKTRKDADGASGLPAISETGPARSGGCPEARLTSSAVSSPGPGAARSDSTGSGAPLPSASISSIGLLGALRGGPRRRRTAAAWP